MKWIMIYKMDEMEMNDEKNELNFEMNEMNLGMWDEWDDSD